MLPSLANEIRRSKQTPAYLYENYHLTAGSDSLEQQLNTPRSKNQIKYLQQSERNLKGDPDMHACLLRMNKEYNDLKLLMFSPRLIVGQISPEMTSYVRKLLKEISFKEGGGLQLIGYDTAFRIGNFYCSTLCIKDVTKRTASKACPTLPVCFIIHEKKRQMDHDIAFQVMVEKIPELAIKMFIAISDNEFTETLRRHFLKAFIAVDEIHATKDIVR